MMERLACLRALAEARGDAVVVTRYSPAFALDAIAPHPLTYTATGAMGQCSSWALGMAVGMPDHKIIVIDGDGSLLMNLGSLVTIATVAPKNFVHFVWENGCYEVNGKQPIPGHGVVNFAGLARDAGYKHTFEFDDVSVFAAEVGRVLSLPGPVFVTLKIDPDAPELAGRFEAFAKLDSLEGREAFRAAIQPFLRSAPVRVH